MSQLMGPQLQEFLTNHPFLAKHLGSILNTAEMLALLVIIFVPLERLFAAHPSKVFRKGFGIDLGYYFLNSLLPAIMLSAPAALLIWAVHSALNSVGAGSVLRCTEGWPFWARALLAMVLGEIGYYWGHRWSHEIPFLWRFHSIHHSAEEVDFMVSTRGHPIDVVFGRICALIPVFVVGLAGADGSIKAEEIPFTVTLFGSLWGFFVHANLKWRFGPLEWIVSTPGFHHWHHTKSGPINHNYASVFPWLDRLFGTHHLPREFPCDYGIQATVPDSLIGQLVYPLSPEEPRAGSQPVATPIGEEPPADRNEAIVADGASVGTDTRPVGSEVDALQPGS